MKKLEPLEANHTKLKANFASCKISLWLRNHKPFESPKRDLCLRLHTRASTATGHPSPVEDAPLSPHSRRYETRRPPTIPGASSFRPKKSSSRPLKKKSRVSEPIDLSEPSSEPPPEPQPSQPPAIESQIPSSMTLRCLSGVPWSLTRPLRVIWIAGLGHSIPSSTLTQPLSNFSQSLGTPSICCRGTIWST
ncbi:hypothetical protein CK203_062861 [Vitis vinifera]|uniref:Uncharacterized protein n=1 Tax=Vitis vinifera TaxID=29760 RepID=A0A438FSN5_VITVI|nr:hypothetical protein CK203_062861 [Vitis vinifera]